MVAWPASRPALVGGQVGGGQGDAAAAGSPFLFIFNPAGRDVGMEFGDVGFVRISFAINSKPFSTHSD